MYTKKDQLDKMMSWEEGSLSEVEEISLFSGLISTGLAWQLQGCYGRAAQSFIQNNIISQKGKILVNLNEIYD